MVQITVTVKSVSVNELIFIASVARNVGERCDILNTLESDGSKYTAIKEIMAGIKALEKKLLRKVTREITKVFLVLVRRLDEYRDPVILEASQSGHRPVRYR